MKEHPKNAKLHEYAAAALAALAITSEICELILELNGLDLLFTSFKRFTTEEAVEASVTQILDQILHMIEDARAPFVKYAPIDILYKVMNAFMKSNAIVYNVCGIVSSLAKEIARKIGRNNDFLSLIDKCMDFHQTDGHTESHVIEAVGSLCIDSNCLSFFIQAQTYLLIRDILNDFQKDITVVAATYKTLLCFIQKEECVEELEKVDILTLSNNVLHCYLEDASIVTDICTFLIPFATKDEWLIKMGALGFVNKCVLVMSRHSEDRATVLSNVHLLRAMHRPIIQKSFEGSNIVIQLIECSSKYLLDAEALLDILTLLEEMCIYDPQRNALGEVIAFLVKAMRSYSNNNALQKVACTLIAHVSENKNNWSNLLKGECVETVIVASITYPEDADIQHYALEFFSRISSDSTCRDSLRNHNAILCILDCMSNNATVKHVQQFGAMTLRLLALEEVGANTLSQGKMTILFDDYINYKDDEDVIVPLLGIFTSYAMDMTRDYIPKMLEQSFLEQLILFLQNHRKNVELQSEVYEVISYLCANEEANEYFFTKQVPMLAILSLREELEKRFDAMVEEERLISIDLITNVARSIRCLLKNREVKAVVNPALLELFGKCLEIYRKEEDAVLALCSLYGVLAKEPDYIQYAIERFPILATLEPV